MLSGAKALGCLLTGAASANHPATEACCQLMPRPSTWPWSTHVRSTSQRVDQHPAPQILQPCGQAATEL